MQKRTPCVVLAVAVMLASSACLRATPQPTVQPVPVIATSAPTATPVPPTATYAPTATPVLSPEYPVEALCLEVQQSYPQLAGDVTQPIAEDLARILAGVGLEVVPDGALCDATLSVDLSFSALGEEYKNAPRPLCYTGAQVGGELNLTLAANPSWKWTRPIAGEKPPTQGWITSCPAEDGAPFRRAWPEPLLEGLAEVWDLQPLVQALLDDEGYLRDGASAALGDGIRQGHFTREEAAEAVPALIEAMLRGEPELGRDTAAATLGEIGPEAMEAVPALISVLTDNHREVREASAEALSAIAGGDYGTDVETWQAWWQAQHLDP